MTAATPAPAPAPASWEADVVLNDGGTVHLRPIRPDDGDRLREFHSRLSQQTVFNRYFAYRPTLSDQDVHRFTHVDHDSRVAFVATLHGAEIKFSFVVTLYLHRTCSAPSHTDPVHRPTDLHHLHTWKQRCTVRDELGAVKSTTWKGYRASINSN